jgi:hypothetical protein
LEYRHSVGEHSSTISAKEFQLLYVETLYTIKHKIGSSTSKYNEGETTLYAYAQEAFALSNEDHQRFLDKASEEKVCRDSEREMNS